MSEPYEQQAGNEQVWAQVFGAGHPELNKQHSFHSRLPRDPRCKLCFAPFAGLGGIYMRFKGKGRSNRNPNFCNACDGFLEAFPGGAEVEMSIIFVDIRNSTGFAQSASPGDVSARINAFLSMVTQKIIAADGFILAFYGDCVVGVWPPGFSGADHAAKALGAAKSLVGDAMASDIPYGVGLHSGAVYIGTVEAAQGMFRDISIFGHNVNLTARLASAAGPSEALISDAVFQTAKAADPAGGFQDLQLKGITGDVRAASIT